MRGISAVHKREGGYQRGNTPPQPIGGVLAGRYRLIRPLGQGGMASVFLAEDLVLGKSEVAIKILKDGGRDIHQTELVDRFIREVQLTHQINHEHVVRTFDFGRDGDSLFYTMEYLSGMTLDRVIQRGRCSVETANQLAVQLVRGLAAIHAVGVVHRDLKPANIILSDSGTLKITDFGIARSSSAQDTANVSDILGTLSYVAPEVIQGEVASRAADFYALGVILYELLVGELPFPSNNPAQVILAKLEDEPPLVSKRRSDVPQWLANRIADLLSRDTQRRESAIRKIVTQNPANEDCITKKRKGRCFLLLSGGASLVRHLVGMQGASSETKISDTGVASRWVHFLLVVLCALFAIPLGSTDVANRLELDNLDLLFRLRGFRAPHPDIMIVAIDEQSYSHLHVPLTAPWPRDLHAQLVSRLAAAGAKRIVFDVLFTQADITNTQDQDLARAMTGVPTVLGAALGFAQKATIAGAFLLEELLQPADMFERESVGVGVVGLPQRYGRLGHFFQSPSQVFPNLSSLSEMAVLADLDSSERPRRGDRINFYGPSQTIPTVSYEAVLEELDDERLKDVFQGKIIFVGLQLKSSTGPSQRDAFATPFSAATYGTEIHATAASNLLQRDWIREPSLLVRHAVVLITVVVLALMVVYLSGASALLTIAATLITLVSVQYVMFLLSWYIPCAFALTWGACVGTVMRIVFAANHDGQSRRNR